ncbi:MAG TPA: BadF/BadG/BcrA/BcrD ATPase family protein [Longimicrobiaceae bacterium]|nr:BadF/BadG/BcrA/BcrD ATPase family protein [Longimicrobiaceae bacterium]
MSERYYAGADGGGTKTTVALADAEGRVLARRMGPAGLVDPRNPQASARVVADLLREARRDAGLAHAPTALVAGLAGVGNPVEREAVRAALEMMDAADSVRVVSDGEIALEGALGGGPGVLLIAGTGSVAYGRAVDGRIERCGGWGMVVGDEGSGFAVGRAGLAAALRAHDGRGAGTALLDVLMKQIGVADPRGIPPWAGRAEKAAIAALARPVLAAAEAGDGVAMRLVTEQAGELARHVAALASQLGPWTGPVDVVFHGGTLRSALYARLVADALAADPQPFNVRPPVADAVAGALGFALGRALV